MAKKPSAVPPPPEQDLAMTPEQAAAAHAHFVQLLNAMRAIATKSVTLH